MSTSVVPPDSSDIPSSTYGTAATSGLLSGVLVHEGDWTSTGPITAQGLRLYVTGAIRLLHDVTVLPEISASNRNFRSSAGGGMVTGQNGLGLGGGQGQTSGGAGGYGSAGAGSFGGLGGNCGSALAAYVGLPGASYTPDLQFCGSGGSSGWMTTSIGAGQFGGAGGLGGGGIYLQGLSVYVASTIVASGTSGEAGDGTGNQQQGSGGPGSGGVIEIRSSNDIILTADAVLQANGANGTEGYYASTGGGGGGYIRLMAGGSISSDATIEVSGGTAAVSGAGQVEPSTNGSAGVISQITGQFTQRSF